MGKDDAKQRVLIETSAPLFRYPDTNRLVLPTYYPYNKDEQVKQKKVPDPKPKAPSVTLKVLRFLLKVVEVILRSIVTNDFKNYKK